VPDRLCVELRSWKLYLWSYRNEGAFHEAIINRILDDLVAAVHPRRARVEGDFNIRGGIHTTVAAEYQSACTAGCLPRACPDWAERGTPPPSDL